MGCSNESPYTASFEEDINLLSQIIDQLKDSDPSIRSSGEIALVKLAEQREV